MKKIFALLVMMSLILCFAGCQPFNKIREKNNVTKTQQENIVVENNDETKENLPLTGKIICVDAGHGLNSYNKQEPIAPNSTQTKIAFASGTKGQNQTEEELNLSVALKLESKLEDNGALVYMTRTTHESDMTNIDRAEFANKYNADISVKIHADGLENSSAHGVSILIPSNKYINNQELCEKSKSAGSLVLKSVITKTNATNRGLVVREDLTGFNWSKVPIILLEMGFMTNSEEDKRLESDEYQNKIVDGIVDGIFEYFRLIDE